MFRCFARRFATSTLFRVCGLFFSSGLGWRSSDVDFQGLQVVRLPMTDLLAARLDFSNLGVNNRIIIMKRLRACIDTYKFE